MTSAILNQNYDTLDIPLTRELILNCYTDSVIRVILIIFFVKGCFQGIGKSVRTPVSLVLGGIISLLYYQATADLVKTMLISLISPIILSITISLTLKFFTKTIVKDKELSPLSRLGGGAVSLTWNSIYLCLVLIFISIFPGGNADFQAIQKDVLRSNSFALAKDLSRNIFPIEALDIKTLLTNLQDVKKIEKLRSTKAFKRIINNKKFMDFLTDETITKDLMNKDITKVLSNPKLQSILKDKELLEQLYDLNKTIISQNAETDDSNTDYNNYFSQDDSSNDEYDYSGYEDDEEEPSSDYDWES